MSLNLFVYNTIWNSGAPVINWRAPGAEKTEVEMGREEEWNRTGAPNVIRQKILSSFSPRPVWNDDGAEK